MCMYRCFFLLLNHWRVYCRHLNIVPLIAQQAYFKIKIKDAQLQTTVLLHSDRIKNFIISPSIQPIFEFAQYSQEHPL